MAKYAIDQIWKQTLENSAVCQLSKKARHKYGKFPPRNLELRPWHTVSIDFIGPFTIKTKSDEGTVWRLEIKALTMIDPSTG